MYVSIGLFFSLNEPEMILRGGRVQVLFKTSAEERSVTLGKLLYEEYAMRT